MPADFLDSNVLICALDARDPAKQAKAKSILASALDKQTAVISFQVVQEVLNVASKRLAASFSAQHKQTMLDKMLLPLCKLHSSPDLYAHALKLHNAHQFSIYDSLVVASAITLGCKRLLSEDMQNGQLVGGVRIVNPFK